MKAQSEKRIKANAQVVKTQRYDHTAIESKWQSNWSAIGLDRAHIQEGSKPYYNLMMFPYPSAEGLHVGNMYAFTGSDIYGRFKRMQGYSVFEPIGLDGFGIHSENYAFKVGRHPVVQAKYSEDRFYEQLHKVGCMYDWSRTVETYNPDYYRWTQWLFVQMFKNGLAYRAKASVNWCPSCKTVLADEQVIEGACERCGNKVEKRLLQQWFFRITAYAEKLLQNISKLGWSEKVLTAQKNWIGKKSGINISYDVVDGENKSIGSITCFTTRPDTNFGATFVVMAPEHAFISRILKVTNSKEVDSITRYVNDAKKKSETDRMAEGRKKTGVSTGCFCINQLTGKKMPLYISDFVLMGFGSGAVVGVPGHDRRDFEFAKVFHLPIERVVVGPDGDTGPVADVGKVQEETGRMINSGFLDGMDIRDAITAMMDHLEQKGWGKRVVTYHLRDWLISRQRYWGPPIPMIYCEACARKGHSWFTSKDKHNSHLKAPSDKSIADRKNGTNVGAPDDGGSHWDSAGWYPVEESVLPVILPDIKDYKPGDDGVAPLAKHKEFYETTCPGCGGRAVRETDVSDTFLDSSWYFLRYPTVGSPNAGAGPFDKEITKKWLPVSMYTGGAEHSVLHLMYSRFITMALHDWGFIDFDEPFPKFFAHGLIIKDGAKMSKSKGNVVNPDEYIATYGVDALRLYLMFMGPFSEGGDFRDSAMEGMYRWVTRVWRMAEKSIAEKPKEIDPAVRMALHRLVQKATDDLEKRRYNTTIAAMMEFTNLVADNSGAVSLEALKTFLLVLTPFAPHLSEEIFQRVTGRGAGSLTDPSASVNYQSWPVFDTAIVRGSDAEVVIQVNGKVREKLVLTREEAGSEETVKAKAAASPAIQKYTNGKKVAKVIFITGKLINFVVV